MPKPNPEVFAKQVLWALAGIQAQIIEVQAMLTAMSGVSHEAIEKMTKEADERRLVRQKDLFDHRRTEAGLGGGQSDGPRTPPASRN